MQAMFEGYLKNPADEIKKMIGNILLSGEKSNIKTVHLKELQKIFWKSFDTTIYSTEERLVTSSENNRFLYKIEIFRKYRNL